MAEQKFEVNNPGLPPNPTTQQPEMPSAPPVTIQQTLIAAVAAQYIAQRARSTANINTYIMNAVGVAEHPDIVGELVKLVEEIDHAESVLATLKRITTQP